jgi:hypothetical protein
MLGTVYGSPAWNYSPYGATGPTLTATTSQYTGLGSPAVLEVYTRLTLAAWAKSTNASGTAWILAKDGASGSRGYGIGQAGTGALYLEVDGTNRIQTASNTIATGEWFRVVLTFDAATWRLYKNGVQLGTNGYTFMVANSTCPWEIGRRNYSGVEQPFGGTIADVSFWNRPLSADEVIADYTLSRQGYPQVLNRYTPKTWVFLGTAAAPAGNRRRRTLICGGTT